MPKIALYAGSFDPITKGHLDIIKRSLDIFDKLIIVINTNLKKNHMFSLNMRKHLLNIALMDLDSTKYGSDRIEIILNDDELTVDIAKRHNAKYLVRGLRMVSDFEYEMQLEAGNKSLSNTKEFELDTVFLIAPHELSFVSSSSVREILMYSKHLTNEDLMKSLSPYVPSGIFMDVLLGRKINI